MESLQSRNTKSSCYLLSSPFLLISWHNKERKVCPQFWSDFNIQRLDCVTASSYLLLEYWKYENEIHPNRYDLAFCSSQEIKHDNCCSMLTMFDISFEIQQHSMIEKNIFIIMHFKCVPLFAEVLILVVKTTLGDSIFPVNTHKVSSEHGFKYKYFTTALPYHNQHSNITHRSIVQLCVSSSIWNNIRNWELCTWDECKIPDQDPLN